jgi:hypothetical protein
VLGEITGSTTEVKIIQKWDGNRPAINWLLREFRRYLIQEKIDNNVAERTVSAVNIWFEAGLKGNSKICDSIPTSTYCIDDACDFVARNPWIFNAG